MVDTVHAVKDHNTIRHLEEEENDVLPPFRESVDEAARSELGMAWLAFHEEHERVRGLPGDDVDPQAFVEEHAP